MENSYCKHLGMEPRMCKANMTVRYAAAY